jgi:putative intracellular protease/amidase
MLKENGAHYEKKGPFEPFVIEDGLLITGQNPASSEPAAEKLLALLNA